jgi:hypothetical protein
MDDPTKSIPGWQWFAIGSAFFAALTALLGKVGVSEMNSNLATLLRTAVILGLSAGVVTWRGEWQPGRETSARAVTSTAAPIATGRSDSCRGGVSPPEDPRLARRTRGRSSKAGHLTPHDIQQQQTPPLAIGRHRVAVGAEGNCLHFVPVRAGLKLRDLLAGRHVPKADQRVAIVRRRE